MADYTNIINGVHYGDVEMKDSHESLIIDAKTREVLLPADFNPIIGYVGDINAQIVSFSCPNTYDAHALLACSNHEIRWYNTGSAVGGVSKLAVSEGKLLWRVPPEAMTKAGTLQCVISIYDKEQEDITEEWLKSTPVDEEDSDFTRQGKTIYPRYDHLDYGSDCELSIPDGQYRINITDVVGNWYFGYISGSSPFKIEVGPIQVNSYGPIWNKESEGWEVQESPFIRFEYEPNGQGLDPSLTFQIYDDKPDGKIKYQWNTAPFTSLSIGATLDNVDIKAPTKDKILTLDTQTRNVTLPAGYNTTIATKGDIGTAFVYIQCPRYIAGMDLTSNKIKKYLGWSTGEFSDINECTVEKIYSEVEKDDLVLLTWDVDENLTTRYAGVFSFELSFKEFNEDDTILKKQWYSNSNNSLSIKETLNIDGDSIPTPIEHGGIRIELDATINEDILLNMLKEKFNYGGN